MTPRLCVFPGVILLLILACPVPASAGMPSFTVADVRRVITLTDLTRQRLEAISFFLLVLLACAGVIQGIWNALRTDFVALPRLSYAKATGLVVLWGLLFVLVLTMISGARELMTPGAWEKRGLTYRLAQDSPPPVERQITARCRAIQRLGEALVDYARGHGGAFPAPDSARAIPEALWLVPGSPGQRYAYAGGRMLDEESRGGARPLAYEPEAVGPDRLVVRTDGTVLWLPASEIERALMPGGP